MAIYVYTGEGKGKTTAALGVALRALGHGMKVIMIQFMKGRKGLGEVKFQKRTKGFKVYQFGQQAFIGPAQATEKDRELARKGLLKVLEAYKEKPDVLILDELNIAVDFKLLKIKDVLAVVRKAPKKMHLIITGRYANKKILELADVVSEIAMKKYPQEMILNKGVEY